MSSVADIHYTVLSAIRSGKAEVVRSIISSEGLSLSTNWCNGYVLLREAIEYKQKEIAKFLINEGAAVNGKHSRKSNTALHLAVRYGYTDLVQLLLNRNADVNILNHSEEIPLHLAISSKNEEICRLLLRKNSNPNVQDISGFGPLHHAASLGLLQIAKELIKYGACINSSATKLWEWERERQTPLHFATGRIFGEIAHAIAAKLGASTALDIAITESNEEIVELLLEHNANVNALNKRVLSPLQLASTKENVTIVKTLLKYGADVNCEDRFGETALHHFCGNLHVEGVKYLLDYGADINAVDNHGYTPLNNALVYLNDSDIYSSKSIAIVEHIIRNMVRMLGAKMHVSDKNLIFNTLSAHPGANHVPQSVYKDHFLNFRRTCEEEMQEMKHQKISGNISFSDLLIKNLHQVAAYERNENIAQVLDLGGYKRKFPIYAEMLEAQVLRGKRRNELFECASKALYYCSKSILPYPVTQEILLYLSEKDLITLSKFYQQHFDSSDTNINN